MKKHETIVSKKPKKKRETVHAIIDFTGNNNHNHDPN